MAKKLNSPVLWFGGKGVLASKFIPVLAQIPHSVYVEPFGGGASILIAKPKVQTEVYNELDIEACDFFRVIQDKDMFDVFYRRIALLPSSREMFMRYKEMSNDIDNMVERAARWFYVLRSSFTGNFGQGWKYERNCNNRAKSSTVHSILQAVVNLPAVHDRMKDVILHNEDYKVVLDLYDGEDTLFYCDPPYVHSTRSEGMYKHELSDDDHRVLVDSLLKLKGNVVLSGYANDIYKPLEDAGWTVLSFAAKCARRNRRAEDEILWVKSVSQVVGKIGFTSW